MWMERGIRIGNNGQLEYGLNMTITRDYRSDSRSRCISFQSFFYAYVLPFLSLIYIVASAVVLVLSKHEKPHMPLRTWIVGIMSGAAVVLVLLAWYLIYQKYFLDILSTYDIDMILDGKTPVTGFDLHALRVCQSFETPLDCFRFAFIIFRWVWLFIGCLWIWKESSFCLDAPWLYWLCLSLAISSGVECVTQLFISAARCYYHL